MVMQKEEVIKAMTEAINDMNRQMAWENGVSSDQVDETLASMQTELNRVNAIVYDKLSELGMWATS